eukprot:2439518-Pleurochrysis_carterae.AAC.1
MAMSYKLVLFRNTLGQMERAAGGVDVWADVASEIADDGSGGGVSRGHVRMRDCGAALAQA